ncbi:MAG: DUF748 domain-containing protein [Gammaproteobacteria bacterium]|nr:DUF748 domain-containing protein [Gammaproteobacteria bacterium]
MSGEISTLSSVSAEPARVELEGEVEGYGLASISGTIHAWQPMRETNLKLTFRNLQIPEYSPYTVSFAGRKIATGTMDLDLEYTIADRQLDGRNNLVLRDLKLGERMETPNAMDLPLDMAVALLKDKDGVIDLDLPVTGNVGTRFQFPADHPSGAGQRALFDRAGTLPISCEPHRCGIRGSRQSRIPGRPQRSDTTHARTSSRYAEALQQRPALARELAGTFDPALDGLPLRRRSAMEELQKRLKEADRELDDPSLSAESTREIVETMFANHYPDTDLEKVRARFTETSEDSPEEEMFDGLCTATTWPSRSPGGTAALSPRTWAEALGNVPAVASSDAAHGAGNRAGGILPPIACVFWIRPKSFRMPASASPWRMPASLVAGLTPMSTLPFASDRRARTGELSSSAPPFFSEVSVLNHVIHVIRAKSDGPTLRYAARLPGRCCERQPT